jgi:hypothetical protein
VGQGASGTVYRGTDEQTGQAVAVKEMAFRLGDDAKTRELVAREGRVLRQLSHPGIPRWLDEVVAGSGRARALFLVQEFIEGRALDEELAEHRWSEDEVLALMEEVLGILGYLHSRHPPVIHRDLKPGNLRRRPDGRVVLVDFGAVRDALAGAALGGSTVAGTFGFMAPEQFRGHAEPATDLYALGVIVVALLSRRDPSTLHDRAGRLEWRSAVSVSPALTALLAELLAPDPGERPASASAVAGRVGRIRAGETAAPIRAPRAAPEPGRPPQAPAFAEAPTGIAPERPFEAPVPREHRPPAGTPGALPARPARSGPSSVARVAATAVALVMGVLVAVFVLWSRGEAEPPPPMPAPARPMPVPEARPVPELQGNTLVQPAQGVGTSRCIMLGGELGAHRDELPVQPGTGVVLRQPAVRYPPGVGEPGDSHVCELRFAVDPEGIPAEVGITTEGCPAAYQHAVCDAADEWRFAAPAEAAAAGGFIVQMRVRFEKE